MGWNRKLTLSGNCQRYLIQVSKDYQVHCVWLLTELGTNKRNSVLKRRAIRLPHIYLGSGNSGTDVWIVGNMIVAWVSQPKQSQALFRLFLSSRIPTTLALKVSAENWKWVASGSNKYVENPPPTTNNLSTTWQLTTAHSPVIAAAKRLSSSSSSSIANPLHWVRF